MRIAWVALALVLLTAGSAGARQTGVEPAFADSWPAWSKDGTQIAFSRMAVTAGHTVRDASLYVANADGSHPRVVVQGDPANDAGHTNAAYDPTWSPDGTRLAYALAHRDNRYTVGFETINVVNADGTGDHAITPTPAPGPNVSYSYEPAWSPTGGKIAFVQDGTIVLANEDGSSPTSLTTAGGYTAPAWSSDSAKIAYGGPGGLYVMNADGTGQTPIFTVKAATFPSWSPDGSRIAFATEDTSSQYRSDIWVVNEDGTGAVEISHGRPFDDAPTWSSDGRTILFSSDRRVGVYGAELWLMDSDGAGARPLVARHERASNGKRCTMFGTDTVDLLVGTSGADVLCGFGGADRLVGGAGNDVLDGARGTDVLDAGSGADLILARDHRRDDVRGGAGRDRAKVDRRVDKVRGVERFLR